MLKSSENRDHYLTEPQAKIMMIDPNEAYIHLGRRGGKSTEILPHLMLNRVKDMPRAGFLFLGRTYQQVLTRTLPGVLYGWEKRGFYENVHYVIGKKPPTNWPKTHYAPKDYKHFISTISGTGFHIGSQDREGLVNSLTVWGIYGDESKFLMEERFKEDAVPANTAPAHFFPDHPHNRTIVLTSSMPDVPSGNWLFEMEERMDEKLIKEIFFSAVYLEHYREKYLKADPFSKPKLKRIVDSLQAHLDKLRRNAVLYVEASTFANIMILGIDYFRQQKETSKEKFIKEICNVRPSQTTSPFYANLREKSVNGKQPHFYTSFNYGRHYDSIDLSLVRNSKKMQEQVNCKGDDDVMKSQPLAIGIDFGHRINCIITGQHDTNRNRLKLLKNHFVKQPKILNDVCEDWCKYYRFHPTKRLILFYDKQTGNLHMGNSKDTMAEQAVKIFEKHGWSVEIQPTGGQNPQHDLKYLLWNLCLIEDNPRFPSIRINEANCSELRQALLYTPAKDVNGKTKKDKSSEALKSIPDEVSTDMTDAADYLLWGLFSQLLHDDYVEYYDIVVKR
jgi:hypothetical protein